VPRAWRLPQTPLHRASESNATTNKKRLRNFRSGAAGVNAPKIIAALEVAFAWVVFDVHLAAGPVPGRDRLMRAPRLVVAAVVAVVVAAAGAAAPAAVVAAADQTRLAVFPVGHVLPPLVPQGPVEARPADEVPLDLREVRPVPLLA